MLHDEVKQVVADDRSWAVAVESQLLVLDPWEVAGCSTAIKAVSCLWTEVLIPSARD